MYDCPAWPSRGGATERSNVTLILPSFDELVWPDRRIISDCSGADRALNKRFHDFSVAAHVPMLTFLVSQSKAVASSAVRSRKVARTADLSHCTILLRCIVHHSLLPDRPGSQSTRSFLTVHELLPRLVLVRYPTGKGSEGGR